MSTLQMLPKEQVKFQTTRGFGILLKRFELV